MHSSKKEEGEAYHELVDIDDQQRGEEPWLDCQEALLKKWRDEAETLSTRHEHTAKREKQRHNMIGFPAVVIPVVMGPLCSALRETSFVSGLETTGFVLSAITSGMVQFFNFSAKAERHYNFSARYQDLVTDIDQELAKPRAYRQQVDTFSLGIKMTYDALNRGAPAL